MSWNLLFFLTNFPIPFLYYIHIYTYIVRAIVFLGARLLLPSVPLIPILLLSIGSIIVIGSHFSLISNFDIEF